MGFWDDIKSTFKNGNSLTRLIYLNIALFLIITIIGIIGFLLNNPEIVNQTIRFLSVPSSLKTIDVKTVDNNNLHVHSQRVAPYTRESVVAILVRKDLS